MARTLMLAAACAIAILVTPHPAAAQANAERAVTAAYNASGQDLFKQFSAAPGNIVFSPYSIGTAMAMALAGARGNTEREMLGALRHSVDREQIDAANGGMIATLNGYDRSATAAPQCPPGTTLKGTQCECPPQSSRRCSAKPAIVPASVKLLVANALMLTRRDGPVSDDYATLLKDKYKAELFRNAGLAEINGWVNRKTEGKIDKILDNLNPLSAAVLLNAVYFKSRWQTPFQVRATAEAPFNLSRSQKIQVPMMGRNGQYALVARQGYRALRMPYEIPELAMVVVLPNDVDGLAGVSARIDAKELSGLFEALHTPAKLVALSLPRFKTEYRAGLVPAFEKAGLKLPFDQKQADFSGITGRPVPPVQLYISQIAHRAVIEVTKDGTEAAAATAIEFALTAARRMEEPEKFDVDRPFLFYIVDDKTGAILFAGRISDPRQAAAQ